MPSLFFAHGGFDHEATPPTLFSTARDLANHLIQAAVNGDTILTDSNDFTLPSQADKIEQHLLEGRTVFVGGDHVIEAGGRIKAAQSDALDCPVYRFTQCDAMSIDGSFIGRIENENDAATLAYLNATTNAEKYAVLDALGDTVLFNWVDEDGNTVLNFTLNELACAGPKPDSRDMIMVVNDANGNEHTADVTFYRQETL